MGQRLPPPMNGGTAGYDFFYEPDVQALLPSLADKLREQLDEVERELLRDQSESNPRIRYWHGITTIGMVSTENLEVFFQRANPLVARVIEIQIRL